jgi:hypothetical protein
MYFLATLCFSGSRESFLLAGTRSSSVLQKFLLLGRIDAQVSSTARIIKLIHLQHLHIVALGKSQSSSLASLRVWTMLPIRFRVLCLGNTRGLPIRFSGEAFYLSSRLSQRAAGKRKECNISALVFHKELLAKEKNAITVKKYMHPIMIPIRHSRPANKDSNPYCASFTDPE